MEKRDEELIVELVAENEELRQLWEQHQDFERKLEEFNKRPYLTTEESLERKRLQKLKLAGKDRIESILGEYRKDKG